MREHDLQNQIRFEISRQRLGVSFRTNVGQAWQGERIQRNLDGSITIYNPRPFQTGLPEGFSDLLVIQPIIISPEHVGQLVAAAAFLEVKTQNRKPTPKQLNFLEQMRQLGAKTGIPRSVEDALNILR
ncbi:MAG: VRR-NUC domain-containing protein [Negativicutes bacterium]|nr:VRR-NUC domain-containing protein [Negativicutes bacterium]